MGFSPPRHMVMTLLLSSITELHWVSAIPLHPTLPHAGKKRQRKTSMLQHMLAQHVSAGCARALISLDPTLVCGEGRWKLGTKQHLEEDKKPSNLTSKPSSSILLWIPFCLLVCVCYPFSLHKEDEGKDKVPFSLPRASEPGRPSTANSLQTLTREEELEWG